MGKERLVREDYLVELTRSVDTVDYRPSVADFLGFSANYEELS